MAEQTPALIPITEAECVALMRSTSRDEYLSLSFGVGGVAIRTALSPWAVKKLIEIRATKEPQP